MAKTNRLERQIERAGNRIARDILERRRARAARQVERLDELLGLMNEAHAGAVRLGCGMEVLSLNQQIAATERQLARLRSRS